MKGKNIGGSLVKKFNLRSLKFYTSKKSTKEEKEASVVQEIITQ